MQSCDKSQSKAQPSLLSLSKAVRSLQQSALLEYFHWPPQASPNNITFHKRSLKKRGEIKKKDKVCNTKKYGNKILLFTMLKFHRKSTFYAIILPTSFLEVFQALDDVNLFWEKYFFIPSELLYVKYRYVYWVLMWYCSFVNFYMMFFIQCSRWNFHYFLHLWKKETP
jgi:hypothetical protein